MPKKVLALLKAIIAFGAQEVPERKLLDALWPDEDGDAARQSLGRDAASIAQVAVNENAVRQTGGNLTLDERSCWVDGIAFESRLDHGGRCRGGERIRDPALSRRISGAGRRDMGDADAGAAAGEVCSRGWQEREPPRKALTGTKAPSISTSAVSKRTTWSNLSIRG